MEPPPKTIPANVWSDLPHHELVWFGTEYRSSNQKDDEVVVYKGDLGIPDADDCATGSFCSSCAIPPRVAGGLWSAGVGCDACYFPFGVIRFRGRG